MQTIDLEPLFTELQVGGLTVPNRFVMPGMQRGWVTSGAPHAKLGAYYRRRVEGGVGLIISESVAVDHPSSTQIDHYGRMDSSTFASWRPVIREVKDAGGRILLQMWHEGARRTEGGDGPWAAHPTLSPSGLLTPSRPNGQAATLADIESIRDAFVRSARMAQDLGAHGVEIHGAHGFLLDQFLWSGTNLRDDGYGGPDVRDRARLPTEIIAAVRAACGPDFVISFRFSQWKEDDYKARIAPTPDDLRVLVELVQDAGADVLHASTRRFWVPEWEGSELNLAGWARSFSRIPVITVGSVGLSTDVTETFAGREVTARVEKGLRELATRFARGEFDLVSVGRSLISDPDWITKAREGRYDDVRAFRRSDIDGPVEPQ